MVEIYFTDAAIDDLRRIGPGAVPKVLKKLLILLTDPKAGYPLGGELTGYRKLVVGRNTWRIVYRLVGDAIEICEVWAIGPRADAEVYAEAAARVREAAKAKPQFQNLAFVVERLGRIADGIQAEPPTQLAEAVPKWLADRLVHTVGLPREEVAAMGLEEAVDRWSAYIAAPGVSGG